MAILRNLMIIATALWLSAMPCPAFAERIKDISSFEGVRENQLIGFGLVVGLNGTGDKDSTTKQSAANLLRRMGLAVNSDKIKTKNTASVIVTAKLPPFPRPGTKMDVIVSSIADAKSLQGGSLLLTPLKGPDGSTYALAQGSLTVGGFAGGAEGASVQKNFPTTGRIPEGAIVERDPGFRLSDGDVINLFLNRSDFGTAAEVARKINHELEPGTAHTVDPTTIAVKVPERYRGREVELMSRIQEMEVSVDVPARVVINERTGTVVIGDNVTISPVAIAHGNLTIEVKRDYEVSQPPSFAPKSARTTVVPKDSVRVRESASSLMKLSGVNLSNVVSSLNSLGVTPRDLISILQALKAAGALRAELEII
jgi:flagellar P-ring protein precursor FlgI